MPRLSQKTLTILGVNIALAALILASNAGIRGEIRDFRDELRAEIRDVRAEPRADRAALRAEGRADREAFLSHIDRLIEQQGVFGVRLDGITDPPATTR